MAQSSLYGGDLADSDRIIGTGTHSGGRTNRTIMDLNTPQLVVPDIPVNNTGAELFNQVAQTAGEIAAVAIKERKEAEVKKAEERGAIEGSGFDINSDEPITFEEGNTDVANAYNKHKIANTYNAIKLQSAAKLQEIKELYYNNPVEFENASTKFIKETTKHLYETPQTQAMANSVQDELTLRMKTINYEIKKVHTQEQLDEVNAERIGLKVNIDADNRNIATNMYSKDGVLSTAAIREKHLNDQRLEALYNAKNALTGEPLFNDTQIATFKKNDNQMFHLQAMDAILDNPKTSMADMVKIAKGTYTTTIGTGDSAIEVNPANFIEPDVYKTRVSNVVIKKMKTINTEAEQKQRALVTAMDEKRDLNNFDYITDLKVGKTTKSMAQISEDLRTGVITKETAKAARTIALGTTSAMSDVDVLTEIDAGIIAGKDMKPFILKHQAQMTPKDYRQLLKTNAETLTSNAGILWKQAKSEYDSLYNKKDRFGSIMDGDAQRAAIKNKRNYDRNVQSGMDPAMARGYLMEAGELTRSNNRVVRGIGDQILGYFVYDHEGGGISGEKSVALIRSATELTKQQKSAKLIALSNFAKLHPEMFTTVLESVVNPLEQQQTPQVLPSSHAPTIKVEAANDEIDRYLGSL